MKRRVFGAVLPLLLFSCALISFDEYGVSCSRNPAARYFEGERIDFSFNCDVVHYYAEQAVTIKSGNHRYDAEYVWDGRSLSVKPEAGWIRGKPYLVSIDGLMHTENDASFQAYAVCAFIYGNEADRFFALSLPERRYDTDLQTKLVFSFNKKIEESQFEKAFSLSPAAEYSTALSDDGKTVVVSPSPNWKMNTTYAWTVKRLFSSDGFEMQETLSNTFSTKEDPENPALAALCPVTDMSPDAPWLTDIPLDKNISEKQAIGFVFSKPMDFDSVKDAVSISPPISGYMIRCGDSSERFLFVPEEHYKSGVEYTLSISASAQDKNGMPLFEKYIHCFYAADVHFSVIGLLLDADAVSDFSGGCIKHVFYKNADGDGELTAHILFSHALADDFLTAAANAVTASLLFPFTSSSPVKTAVFWNEDRTRLTVTWTRFTVSTSDVLSYYRLKIAGGPSGITDGRGGYMEKDICINLLAK